jgi:hypothetical protein
VVVAVWLAAATVVGVLVGRVIRQRDRQTPSSPAPPPATESGARTDADDGPRRVHGWGRRRS